MSTEETSEAQDSTASDETTDSSITGASELHAKADDPSSGHEYPPVQADVRQFTFRAIFTGMLLGGMLSLCNVYLGLKIGWGFNMSITAALLGFANFALLPLQLCLFIVGCRLNTTWVVVCLVAENCNWKHRWRRSRARGLHIGAALVVASLAVCCDVAVTHCCCNSSNCASISATT